MGTTLKARPTTYKGVPMRSRLEAGFAHYLDSEGVPWEYEPECFAGTGGQYLPDFRILLHEWSHLALWLSSAPEAERGPILAYVEVKPNIDAWCPGLLADRAAIIRESEPSAAVLLAIPDHVFGVLRSWEARPGVTRNGWSGTDVTWPAGEYWKAA